MDMLGLDWDLELYKKKTKRLIFIDNCPARVSVPLLTALRIEFLPANTTSKLQPTDGGIKFKILTRTTV